MLRFISQPFFIWLKFHFWVSFSAIFRNWQAFCSVHGLTLMRLWSRSNQLKLIECICASAFFNQLSWIECNYYICKSNLQAVICFFFSSAWKVNAVIWFDKCCAAENLLETMLKKISYNNKLMLCSMKHTYGVLGFIQIAQSDESVNNKEKV